MQHNNAVYIMFVQLADRFNEWGRALLSLQLTHLGAPRGIDWRFLSLIGEQSDAADFGTLRTFINTRVMQYFWLQLQLLSQPMFFTLQLWPSVSA